MLVKTFSSESRSVVSDSLQVHGILQPEHWSGQPSPSPGDLPNPGIEPRSPTLQVDSLPAEPPGKPENTGVGSLSLLQWVFLTEESNRGLLHCRRILYPLSYQETPVKIKCTTNIMHLNHPATILPPQSVEKLSSMTSVPGDKKIRDR